MTDKTRRDFEVECRRYWWPERCVDFDFKDGKYESGRAQLAWAFYQAATAAERERCALVCDSVNNFDNPMTASDCADVIRQRGEA